MKGYYLGGHIVRPGEGWPLDWRCIGFDHKKLSISLPTLLHTRGGGASAQVETSGLGGLGWDEL